MSERGFFKRLSLDDGMCRLYSRQGGPISLKWGEGEKDGTYDREEGLADTSGSHRGVSGKNGFFVILCLECIQYEYTHTHTIGPSKYGSGYFRRSPCPQNSSIAPGSVVPVYREDDRINHLFMKKLMIPYYLEIVPTYHTAL